MRKAPNDITEEILEALDKNAGLLMSPTAIAREAKLSHKTVQAYMPMIVEIQQHVPIEEIEEATGRVRYRTKGLLSLPEKERMEILREQYFPEIEDEDRLYVELLKKRAVSEETAIKIEKTEVVGRLIKIKQLKETRDGRIYLTELGKMAAKATPKLYPELL